MSIRNRLFLILAFFVVAPVLALGGLGYINARKALVENRLESLGKIADLKVRAVEDLLRERKGDLEVLLDHPDLTEKMEILTGDSAGGGRVAADKARRTLDKLFEGYTAAYGYTSAALLDRNGNILYFYLGGPTHGRDKVTGEIPISLPFPLGVGGVVNREIKDGRLCGGESCLMVSGPVKVTGGEVAGEVALFMGMDRIALLAGDRTGMGETGEALIARKDEKHIQFLHKLRHQAEMETGDFTFGGPLAKPMQMALAGESGEGLSKDYRGVEVLAAWRSVGATGWGLVAKVDSSEALKGVAHLRNESFAIAAAALLLGLAAAFITSHSIRNRINDLKRSAVIIGSGDLEHRILDIPGTEELGELALALNMMAGNLEHLTASREELEEEVEQRRSIQRALERSEQKYMTLIARLDDVIYSIDPEGTVAVLEGTTEKTLGIAVEDAVGLPIEEVLAKAGADQKDIDQLMAAHDQAIKSHQKSLTHEIEVDPGERKIIELHTGLRYDDEGNLIGLSGIGRDVTQARKLEEERNSLIKELTEKNEELESYNYTVSHDLRSPLITIAGFSGLLLRHLKDGREDKVKDDLSRIMNASTKMQELLDDLLELSRIGRMANPPENFEVEEVVKDAVELLHGPLEKSGAEVEIKEPMGVVHGDKHRIRAVFQNLIENAIKFANGKAPPRIEIGSVEKNGERRFYIKDEGIGIEPEYLDKIFRLFDKLDQDTEGSGLGLSLVKKIIEVHGGKIWAESGGPGEGATFYLVLPEKIQGNT